MLSAAQWGVVMPENVPTARQEVSPIHFSNPDIPGPEFAFAALFGAPPPS